MVKETKKKNTAKFFIIPEKLLTSETCIGDIEKGITGKYTAFIFKAKKEDHAIGFHSQGSGPFIRYCRYSYPKKTSFKIAFSCQESSNSLQAHLLDEVDIYSKGIIIVRKFTGSFKTFVADDLPDAGIKITRDEFNNTHYAIWKMSI